jgi:hypothetical protein
VRNQRCVWVERWGRKSTRAPLSLAVLDWSSRNQISVSAARVFNQPRRICGVLLDNICVIMVMQCVTIARRCGSRGMLSGASETHIGTFGHKISSVCFA